MDPAPFDFAGDERGVLCIHGFTGTPYEMRFLGESLAAQGMTVVGPALPGHATRVEEMEGVGWRDWVAAVGDAHARLADRCRSVAVVGQSLGGLLALHLAAHRPVAAVASLAAPLWLDGVGGWLARTLTRGPLAGQVRWLPKLGGSDVRARDARRANPAYRRIPVAALAELLDFFDVVERLLPRVSSPVLVVHGVNDHTAPVGSAARIAERVGTGDVRVRLLPRSYHLVAIDDERTVVAAEVARFLATRPSPPVTGTTAPRSASTTRR